jgi:NAD(P)-dependent dehydrogenase (short-subunit alcohol dehydrogenase family)
MDDLLNFTGKVALITGAGGGFGRLLAQGLAKRGCKLVISDINQQNLDDTCASVEQQDSVVSLICDVSKEQDCKNMVDVALEKFGRVDIGVNNAGIAHAMIPLHQLTEATIHSQFAVNVNGVLFGMKYQIEAMLTQGEGHVLNISSLAGLGGAPKGGAYAAAKHAVVGLTRTAALEYARKGVRCNAICPFYSPTPILGELVSVEGQAQLSRGTPMKRLSNPQEVVNAMLLILSPGNSYMTGQTIAIDGGVTAW